MMRAREWLNSRWLKGARAWAKSACAWLKDACGWARDSRVWAANTRARVTGIRAWAKGPRAWAKGIRTRFCAAALACVLVCAGAMPCAFSYAPALAWADEEAASEQADAQTTDAQAADAQTTEASDTTSADQSADQSADESADESSSDNQASGNQVYVNQPSDSSFLYETSIADLAQADAYYDGQTVLVQGEVVGDRVNDEFEEEDCWITLQDPEGHQSVISVNMTKTQSELIDMYGSYAQTGTMLQVRGTFHLDCPEHQGLSDIHAEEVSAVSAGSTMQHAVDKRILYAGVAALVAGAALMAAYYVKRERTL